MFFKHKRKKSPIWCGWIKKFYELWDNSMMRKCHAVVLFMYLLYSGDNSISPINL